VATCSVEVRDQQGDWLSANHCQEGSGGPVYRIDAYSLEEGLEHLFRAGGKRKRKGKGKGKTRSKRKTKAWQTRKHPRKHHPKKQAKTHRRLKHARHRTRRRHL